MLYLNKQFILLKQQIGSMSAVREAVIQENVKANLEIMESILSTNTRLLVSDSLSSINSIPHSQRNSENSCYYPLVRSLLQNLHHPFKILPIYAKLLMLRPNTIYQVDNILYSTLFNEKIFWLLTCYLYDETSYLKIGENAEKIVDVFYKFMYCEHSDLMEERLKEGNVTNIGKWFFEEGLEKLFKKYYFTAHDFTMLLSNFMLHGLVVLFVAAICVLGKKDLRKQLENAQSIKLVYIKKYNLE